MQQDDTIVALATPAGESAIAMLRVSGSLCLPLVRDLFQRENPLPRRCYLGRYLDREGKVLDQVIYTVYRKGASYTGDEVLELSSHGNPLIAQKIIEDLLNRGCRLAEPGEFTRSAFLNGRIDLSQAEAVMDLIRARSEKALDAAQRQLDGSVKKRMNLLGDRLLRVISTLEAYIDFPEEDLPEEDVEGPVQDLRELCLEMDKLIATSQYSTLLKDGIRTVITGAPNAGKSSLLNAITGEERVIVNEEPGTTRDYVEERMTLGPYLLRVVDTAGLQESASGVERLGIEKTFGQLERAERIFYVLDSTTRCPTLPKTIAERIDKERCLVVENKIDLVDSQEHSAFMSDCVHVRLSALTGEGIGGLKAAFLKSLEEDFSHVGEESVIVSARHASALKLSRGSLEAALETMRNAEPSELVASHLRSGLDALSQIAGRVDNEEILDRIFQNFCIGK